MTAVEEARARVVACIPPWEADRRAGYAAVDALIDAVRAEHEPAEAPRIIMLQALKATQQDARITELEEALRDALEGMEDMYSYVPEYFREKWMHLDYIKRAREVLGE